MFASVIGVSNICSLNDTNRHIQSAVPRERHGRDDRSAFKTGWPRYKHAYTQMGKIQELKRWLIMKLQVKCVYVCMWRTIYVCVCVCVCVSAWSLPVVWQESSVGIILVTVVSGKNSVTVSVQSVLGDVSIRLRRLIPVQLHRRCVYYQVSGARPHTWEAKNKKMERRGGSECFPHELASIVK